MRLQHDCEHTARTRGGSAVRVALACALALACVPAAPAAADEAASAEQQAAADESPSPGGEAPASDTDSDEAGTGSDTGAQPTGGSASGTSKSPKATKKRVYASTAKKRGTWKYKTIRKTVKRHGKKRTVKQRVKVSYRFKDGTYPTRICKIGKKYYYFKNSKGKLGRGTAKIRLKKVGGLRYGVGKDGRLKKGWRVIGKSLYYFAGSYRSAVRNKTVDSVILSSTGKAVKTLDESVKRKSIKILDRITSRSASKAKRLRAAWNYMVSRSRFTYTIYGFSLKDKAWAKKYANEMFTTRHGDCYGFAACFAALAHEIGYKKVQVVAGRVPGSRDHAADGYTRHGLVRIGGYYYDPEAQFAGWALGEYHKKRYRRTIKSEKRTTWTAFKGTGKPAGISRAFKVKTSYQVAKIGSKYYGYNHGKKLTGLYCINGKLYRFNRKHYMSAKSFKRYKALSKAKAPWSKLRKAIGKPKSSKASASCYGAGKDYLRTYKHVRVTTFKPAGGGKEIVLSVQAR